MGRDKDRVFACQRADDLGKRRIINLDGHRGSAARQTLCHHQDVAGHLQDLLAKKPRVVWLQSGIRDDRTAEALARAGILVVQDRCLMVDYREVARSAPR